MAFMDNQPELSCQIVNYSLVSIKYMGSPVAADGGCEMDVVYRMNDCYRAWGALKSVLSNRGLWI